MLGVGAIIGTGIFVLTGQAAAANAGPAIVLSMVVAGVTSVLAALCVALGQQGVELGAGHRDLLVGAGRRLVLGALVGARLELLRRLPQRPGELREPGRAEQQEHDGEDDDQLRHANAHLSSLQASARRSTS